MATAAQQSKLRGILAGGGIALKQGFGSGTTANADISITGIKPGDVIVSAFEITDAASVLKTDLTSEIAITAAGKVQCTTTNTSSNQVLVTWLSLDR